MKLTFTKEARGRVQRYLQPGKVMLLDFDDGVGPFSTTGSCTLDGGYRLLFVNANQDLSAYDFAIESNLGIIRIKGESRMQFDSEMEIRFNPHLFTLPLVSRQGMLCENVELLDLSISDHQAENQHDC